MKKLIDLIKLKKTIRELKKENKELKFENKFLKDNVNKCIYDKGQFVIVPKDIFNDIWNKANKLNEVYRYTGNIEDIKKEIKENDRITIERYK